MNITKIIKQKSVKVLFQPIVCVKTKTIIGFEALSRGFCDNKSVSPFEMFSEAKKEGLTLELDDLCREIAVNKYIELESKEKLLFLNFEISELNNGLKGKKSISKSILNLRKNLDRCKIPTENIVIEIVESSVGNMEDLKFFSDLCKEYGFLIALDDVGSGHSNLNRVPLLKPNIIKIDRYLINGMENDYYKQEVFKSITRLARMIGTLIIAEGVETKEEAIYSIEHRTDMIQGYYFCKPTETININLDDTIINISNEFREYFSKKTDVAKDYSDHLVSLSNNISIELAVKNYSDSVLKKYIQNFPFIECLYLINSCGKQISETVVDEYRISSINQKLFRPASIGDDHTLKNYFYKLKVSSSNHYITEPYISMATGNKCTTISNIVNENTILTLDINTNEFSKYFEEIYDKRVYKAL